ncbi:uncharacterized protein LOC125459911 [Stegostoma tigrinum]|uniref:uncharacterized protein LOC125459911 n=1 Tax=Stegostoma tigrinum TaxID=3053191 RepID=UPI00286FD9C0|nr:uncharacterized protein LOC125459911 [Stegostoma tigrinum]
MGIILSIVFNKHLLMEATINGLQPMKGSVKQNVPVRCFKTPFAVCTSNNVTPNVMLIRTLIQSTVTMRCPFSFELNHSNINVYWFREGKKMLLQDDSRALFHVKRGGAYLHLFNVTVRDAGTYFCAVKNQHQTVDNKPSAQLDVYASPAPLNIVLIRSEDPSSASFKLQCRTSGFYPEYFNLTWHRNGAQIFTGFRNEKQAKGEGLYEVVSSLDIPNIPESDTVYMCHVYHVSSAFPANASCTVTKDDFASKISIPVVAGCSTGALAILLCTAAIVKCRLFIIAKGSKEETRNPTKHKDERKQETAEARLMYADLKLVHSKDAKILKLQAESTIYAETKDSMGKSQPNYAALNLKGPKVTLKPEQKTATPLYAAVKNSSQI